MAPRSRGARGAEMKPPFGRADPIRDCCDQSWQLKTTTPPPATIGHVFMPQGGGSWNRTLDPLSTSSGAVIQYAKLLPAQMRCSVDAAQSNFQLF
jgi:hypothetical protein